MMTNENVVEDYEYKRWQVGGLCQVISHKDPSVIGTVLQISELKNDTLLGFVRIPFKGNAYFRVPYDDVRYVGQSYVKEEE